MTVSSSARLLSAAFLALTNMVPSLATAQTADPNANAAKDMKVVIDKLVSLGGKPIESLSAEEARKQPGPADAVKAVLVDQGKKQPPSKMREEDATYPGAVSSQKARIYTPAGKGPFPIIAYFHGGGWVIADIDAYGAGARGLAEKIGAVVVSLEYRHAPEAKFPAAHEDALAGYKWVLANAAKWNGDPARVAVAGESAGGNLAANVAIMARDQKLQAPLYQLLVYPVAGNDTMTKSYQANAMAKPLNKAMMQWFFDKVLVKPEDASNPMLNLVAANLAGLPPATIITAGIDPLMSEGEKLAEKMKAAGVKVHYQNYPKATHEFFGMADVVADAANAQDLAAADLKSAFAQSLKK